MNTQIHSALQSLQYRDGVLTWAGRKLTEVVDEAGQTPLYVYDRARMSARVEELRATLPTRLHIYYAIKANPMPAVVAHMAELLDGLDIASAGELNTALETVVDRSRVSFAGPGKRDFEIQAAIEAGVTISVESVNEMQRIAALADSLGMRPNIVLRVNPVFELKSAGMKMGGRPSPFGIDAEQVPAALAKLKSLDLCFKGFHVYAWSQSLHAEGIAACIGSTVDLVLGLAAASDSDVATVNLGGGLGIPYFAKDRPLELATVAEAAECAVERLGEKLGDPEVIMELGRYLVGEAGVYVCRIVDVKESRGRRYAIADGGLHHHLSASGNLGQVIRRNYPIAAVERRQPEETTTIVGPLCTPLDVLGDRVTISRLDAGALIAVLQSGAYGKTASPENFLSHHPAAEILL